MSREDNGTRAMGWRLRGAGLITGLMVSSMAVVPVATAGASARAGTATTPIGALLATLVDPGTTANDDFGYSVAISGKTAVVGAYDSNSGSGAAYIYVKGPLGWPTTPTATLAAPIGNIHFGLAVALSGTTAVVGAPNSNAAYIYVKRASGWPTSPTTTLAPSGGSGAFGYSVAVSGKTAVVGAIGTNDDAGSAYIYVKRGSGWSDTPTATLNDPAATANDDFGWSVAVSGTTAVVGAYDTNGATGSTYVYVKETSGWSDTPTATLNDPAATVNDNFGWSVAVSGTTAVVGASGTNDNVGSAYVYVKGPSAWPTTPTTTLAAPAGGNVFGWSVAVSGKTAVVGAPGPNSNAGSAYIYVKKGSGWPITPTTTLAGPAGSIHIGGSVSVSGKTAAVGAPGTDNDAGSADIYQA